MKGLNLSKFKKVSSDKNSTLLHHADGHSLKVAHSRLHPELRKQLEGLPIHKAQGGEVKRYAEGSDEPVQSEEQKPQAPVVINVGNQAQPAQPPVPQQPMAQAPVAPSPQAAPQSSPEQQVDEEPKNDQGLATPQAGPWTNLPKEASGNHFIAGQTNPSDDASNMPDNPHAGEQAPVTQEEHKKMFLQQYDSEDKHFANDLNNGHVTPETYGDLFAKRSTLGKVGMIFGMMASGVGSGLTGQPNALLTMMNNEIQNDLNAQIKSKDNAQNLIKLNQQHLMNEAQVGLTGAQAGLTSTEALSKAIATSNMQMNRMALHEMKIRTDRLPVGSLDRQKAEQALALMYNAVNTENFNIADRAAAAQSYYKMMLGQGIGGDGSVSEEGNLQNRIRGLKAMGTPQTESIAKDIEEKHFPGLKGQSTIPLNGSDRESINSGIDFDQKLNRFIDWTKKHSGDLNPQDRKAGQAMAAELQGAYRQATHGGVYKEGEQNFISKLIDSTPTKFFNEIRVLPQLNTISNENRSRVNQLVKSKGFQGYEGATSSIPQTVERMDPKSGKTAVFDANTKKFINWK